MTTDTGAMVSRYLPLLVVAVTLLLGGIVLRPFGPALLWAVFVSVALGPVHDGIARTFGQRKGWATALVAAALLVLVVLPMILLARSIVALLPELALDLGPDGMGLDFTFALPFEVPAAWQGTFSRFAGDLGDLQGALGDALRRLAAVLLVRGQAVGLFLLEFLLGLVLASVILHNAATLGRLVAAGALQLGGPRGADLLTRAALTIRYTVLGILGSAAVQAVVAACAYWLVGAPHWPILAVATLVLGLLQVGPVLIWGPLALWLWADGHAGLAVFMVLWGFFAVGLSDNLVKALVVARGADLPAILVFLGAVGGLLTWGIVGIFLGPVILALCLELLFWWLEDARGPGETPDPT